MTLRDYFEQRAREGSWGALYDRPADLGSYNFHTRRATALGLLAGASPCARVLDAGCGTGDYAEVAERLGGASHGFDFAPTMVAEACRRTRAAACRAHFVVADGLRLPYQDGAFDLVLAQGYIAYFADPAPALAELRRVLAPGGLLVLQCARPDLFGWLDRVLVDPLISLARHRHLPRRTPPPPGWVNVRHPRRDLDRLARDAGLELTARAVCNFNTLPGFLRRRYPRRWIQSSELLTRHHPSWWRFLAVNQMGLYRLRDDPGA
jgi:SAM-dependent methyltransferase